MCIHLSRFKGIDAAAGRYSFYRRSRFRRNRRYGIAQLVLVGPNGSGEKHAKWCCYTPTQIVGLLERAALRFVGAYKGLSKIPYKADGREAGGRLALVAVRAD